MIILPCINSVPKQYHKVFIVNMCICECIKNMLCQILLYILDTKLVNNGYIPSYN